jgi:hypothetical protein
MLQSPLGLPRQTTPQLSRGCWKRHPLFFHDYLSDLGFGWFAGGGSGCLGDCLVSPGFPDLSGGGAFFDSFILSRCSSILRGLFLELISVSFGRTGGYCYWVSSPMSSDVSKLWGVLSCQPILLFLRFFTHE